MIRAFQWDLARQVERLDVLLKLLPHYADWGYQELYLHLEDAVEYPSLPGIARRDAYTHSQLAKLVDTASRTGIKVVPIVNLLGHTQYLIKTPELRDLNELRAHDGSPLRRGQICPLHPRLPEIADKLLRDMAPFCTAGKVHVGLDESFHIGKCPRCRAEIERVGLASHFAGHVSRLHALTIPLRLRLGLWADMLNFIPEAISLLPRDAIAYDWYYYPFSRHPRVELFNFAENDLAAPLRAHGLEYWGCPMNGAFRFEPLPIFSDRLANLRSWWRRCRTTGAAGFLVTSWEAYRLALEMTTVVDAAAASLWLEGAPDDDLDWLTKGFERVLGKPGARSAAKAALACDKYPFSGYARWEIDTHWEAGAAPKVDTGFSQEESYFAHIARLKLPAPLSASVAFRRYLAQRDSFVRESARGVYALRRALAGRARRSRRLETNAARPEASPYLQRLGQLETEARIFSLAIATGRKAARAIWRRSRDPQVRGQNEIGLDADAARLRAWRAWLRAARGDQKKAFAASPVCGAWQLMFDVINFAPAVQKVVVEQQQADGSWHALHSRYTIEFQARAAKPRANIRRLFSVPIDSETDALPPTVPLNWVFEQGFVVGRDRWARRGRRGAPSGRVLPLTEQPNNAGIRISIHGIGQVAIERIELSNGVETFVLAQKRKRTILGRSAPHSGFPDLAAAPGPESILPLIFAHRPV
jgi:hypothetical protein